MATVRIIYTHGPPTVFKDVRDGSHCFPGGRGIAFTHEDGETVMVWAEQVNRKIAAVHVTHSRKEGE